MQAVHCLVFLIGHRRDEKRIRAGINYRGAGNPNFGAEPGAAAWSIGQGGWHRRDAGSGIQEADMPQR